MRFRFFCTLVTLCLCWTPVAAQTLTADVAVEYKSVYVGEPFLFQIQVSGSENPEQPDLSNIDDFTISFKGGQRNSSHSMQIINGQVTQNVSYGYIFNYQFSAKRTGRLIIPPITVHAGGHSAITDSITILVQKPVETEDFKFRLSISNATPYVGEPTILTCTLYLNKNVRSLQFNLPFLEHTDLFYLDDPKMDMKNNKKDLYEINYQGGKVITEKGQGSLDGETYTTLQFKKVLIPKKAGNFKIESSTASCDALMGYRQSQRRNDFFSDFFNNDPFSRREVYKNVTVPSNEITLEISAVPTRNRPPDFIGHVGHYHIKASATPLNVSVGDPITLRLELSGPEYVEHVQLPPLNEQPRLVMNFKIPNEQAEGETSGKTKIFTQTIRALRPDVKEIPPIRLVYFDTETGRFQTTQTPPIPLTVKAAKIVTARDAEGNVLKSVNGSAVETFDSGIAFNYEDLSVIENHRLGLADWSQSMIWLSMIISPPLFFLIILGSALFMRHRNSDPLMIAARKAYPRFKEQLKKAHSTDSKGQATEIVLDALRRFLGSKLRLPGGGVTFNDIQIPLKELKVPQDVLNRLKDLIQTCEAGQYAGGTANLETATLTDEAFNIGKILEQYLK